MARIRAISEDTSIKEVQAYLTTVQTLLIDCETAIDGSYKEGASVQDAIEEMLDILDDITGQNGPLYTNLSDEED